MTGVERAFGDCPAAAGLIQRSRGPARTVAARHARRRSPDRRIWAADTSRTKSGLISGSWNARTATTAAALCGFAYLIGRLVHPADRHRGTLRHAAAVRRPRSDRELFPSGVAHLKSGGFAVTHCDGWFSRHVAQFPEPSFRLCPGDVRFAQRPGPIAAVAQPDPEVIETAG
jgi:hypothetical protein